MRKVAGEAGIVLHIATGIFPYAASGLLAPPWAYVVLYGIWALLLVFGIQLLRTGRKPWALLVPVASVVAWIGIISLGGAVLGWTA